MGFTWVSYWPFMTKDKTSDLLFTLQKYTKTEIIYASFLALKVCTIPLYSMENACKVRFFLFSGQFPFEL